MWDIKEVVQTIIWMIEVLKPDKNGRHRRREVCLAILAHPGFREVHAANRLGRTALHAAALRGDARVCAAIWRPARGGRALRGKPHRNFQTRAHAKKAT